MTIDARIRKAGSMPPSRLLRLQTELGGKRLVSVAGLVGRPVHGRDGGIVGRLADVVVRDDSDHPPVAGFVVKIGQRRAWLHAGDVGGVEQGRLQLLRARFDLTDVTRRPGEIQIVADIIDHQLVDVHGVRVVRASDLYLAHIGPEWHLVGVDVSWMSFLRRALPGRTGRSPSPNQVLDWAGMHSLGVDEGSLKLDQAHAALRLLAPSDLADLLEDLGRTERHELLDDLEPEEAADALEAMDPSDTVAILRDESTERVAELLALMEPDEAVEVLRDLDEGERQDVLAAMEEESRDEVQALLAYEEDTAGGMMTSEIVVVRASGTVGDAVATLVATVAAGTTEGLVVLTDDDGRLIDDVTALELLSQPADRPLIELTGAPWPVTIPASAALREVVEAMHANRGSSLLVVDADNRPLGRIHADDVVDALVRDEERRWPWQSEQGQA